ncbi:MAG: transposase [Clostridia bacterium]|nr:transposase [Clostridia bacterium]
MAKKQNNNPMCVLTMALLTEPWQEHILEKRFAIIEHLKNQLIAMELRKLKNVQRTKAYRNLMAEIEETPKEKRKSLYSKRTKLLRDAGLSEFAFKKDMTRMQKHFAEHIAAQIAHKAASDVWRSFEKYLFDSGRDVHFHKRGTLESVACQTIGNGMSYKDGIFVWGGGQVPEKITVRIPVADPSTDYEREMLTRKIKYVRVVRKWMKTRYKYYLQFTLEGSAVKKERKIAHGRVGLDIGPQTLAISSAASVRLMELAERVNDNHRKKLMLQQKMDRSRRSTNPDNYNPDGTIRRSLPGQRMKWVYSGHYRELAGKVRELERKNAAIRKYEHTCLANSILALGDEVYIETMSFKGLQRRAKETKVDRNGRYQKKKRFGKSLANKAPASFIMLLEAKLSQYGGALYKLDTASFRASQYDHTSDSYRKCLLSERWKVLADGDSVQRDLYSAFLIMNSKSTLDRCDRELCSHSFETFKLLHDAEIDRMKQKNRKYLSSFGIS